MHWRGTHILFSNPKKKQIKNQNHDICCGNKHRSNDHRPHRSMSRICVCMRVCVDVCCKRQNLPVIRQLYIYLYEKSIVESKSLLLLIYNSSKEKKKKNCCASFEMCAANVKCTQNIWYLWLSYSRSHIEIPLSVLRQLTNKISRTNMASSGARSKWMFQVISRSSTNRFWLFHCR